MFTCVTFVGADGDRALVGSDVSELLLYDVANGDLLERHDAQHADGDPRSLRAAPLACPKTLVLSCGSEEVHLWDVANMGTGPLLTFEGSCGAAFDADGSRIVVVGEDLAGTARLVDVATGVTMRSFAPSADGDRAPRLPRSFRHADVSFSPGDGGLFLWGNTLWDARLREPVTRFDRFSDGGGACFHPRGNEAILNSEVWDLRTNRLVRSVASLDGTRLCWTGSGDVAVATYRLPPETDIFHHVRRCKHPLRASFRTLDAADYSEICTVELERAVLDACWDAGTDALCATVEYDHADTRDSVVRVHEVGRRRPEEDDSDAEEEDPDADADDGADSDLDDLDMVSSDEDARDEDDDVAARTAAEIARDEEALAGLRTLLGGALAGRIREAVQAEGAAVDEDDDEDSDDDEESDDDEDDDSDDVATFSDDLESDSESVLLSLSSGEEDSFASQSGSFSSDEDDDEYGRGEEGGSDDGWR